MRCDLCKRELQHGETVYRYVMGWEKMRSKGGGNALALRKVIHPERFACSPCVQVREKQKEALF